MSTTTGFSLAWLRLTGASVPIAQVDFFPGLNVFWGASDTGKSFIFSCIDFMLGAETPPKSIPELKGYSKAFLGITDRSGKRRVFERGVQGGDFTVSTAGDDWAMSGPENFKWKHDPKKRNTISHLLLSLVGMEGAVVVHTKATGKTRTISYRDVAHLTLVHEQRIINEAPPVYPTAQRDSKTGELTTFSYLISGTDWSGVVAVPDIAVQKAAWRGKNELYEQLIGELQQEIGENPPSLQALGEQIAACDRSIAEVASRIDESSQVVVRMMAVRREAWEAAGKAKSRLDVIEQLQERFQLLQRHYDSDVERLKFISEGDFFLAQLGAPHCPFCGGLLEEHSAGRLREEQEVMASIQEAAKRESKKIEANSRDLQRTLQSLRGEKGELDHQVARRTEEIADAEQAIRQELEPRILADKQTLSRLVQERSRMLGQQAALDRLARMNARRAALGSEPKKSRRGGSGINTSPSADALRQFSDQVAGLLRSWRYPDVGVVEFDAVMDLVVNGQPRRNHGKGIRALFHSAFTIGLMQHCHARGLKHPGVVLLDSPLTSYKEKDRTEVAEDVQAGFYEALLTLPEHEQVIIFENKEPPASLKRRMRETHFSGNVGVGRQGFIPPREVEGG